MMFNGTDSHTPAFNGHSMTFERCSYVAQTISVSTFRVASSPNLDDQMRVSFKDCVIPGIDDAKHFAVDNNTFGDGTLKILASCTLVPSLPASSQPHTPDWNEPTYKFIANDQYVTATRTCKTCEAGATGEGDAVFFERETEPILQQRTIEPTCTDEGEDAVAAVFENPGFVTQKVTATSVAALGHVDDGGTVEREPSYVQEGSIVHRCSRCGAVLSRETVPKLERPAQDEPGTDGKGDSSSTSPTDADTTKSEATEEKSEGQSSKTGETEKPGGATKDGTQTEGKGNSETQADDEASGKGKSDGATNESEAAGDTGKETGDGGADGAGTGT